MHALLYDVRKDALKQSKGIEFGEPFFKLIDNLGRLGRIAEEEGLLSLEEAIGKVPTDIKLREEIKWIGDLVILGTDPEEIVEVATAHYWMNDYEDGDALMYYLVLRAFLKMQGHKNGFVVEKFLTFYLPHDEEEKYMAYRKKVYAPEVAKRKSERKNSLFHDDPLFEELTPQRLLLEQEILDADGSDVYTMIRTIDLEGLKNILIGVAADARQKLLNNIASDLVDMLAGDWEHAKYVKEEKGLSKDDIMKSYDAALSIIQKK